jgi:hypothetical protein
LHLFLTHAAKCLEKAASTRTNLTEDPDTLRAALDTMLEAAYKAAKESSDREESSILS